VSYDPEEFVEDSENTADNGEENDGSTCEELSASVIVNSNFHPLPYNQDSSEEDELE